MQAWVVLKLPIYSTLSLFLRHNKHGRNWILQWFTNSYLLKITNRQQTIAGYLSFTAWPVIMAHMWIVFPRHGSWLVDFQFARLFSKPTVTQTGVKHSWEPNETIIFWFPPSISVIKTHAMTTKLTLSVKEDVIKKAKSYAKQTGRSLSELIVKYLETLTEEHKDTGQISP